MAISKVVYGDETLMDISEDTVTSENMVRGITAHGADGEPVIGIAIKSWTGTRQQYENEKDSIPDGTIVNITDDYTPSGRIGGGGIIFEDARNDDTDISDSIPSNTWTSSSPYISLNKGIYHVIIGFTRSSINVSDRGYIRVGNSNALNTYQYIPYVGSTTGVSTIQGIIKVTEDNTPISLRLNVVANITLTKKVISWVKIGEVD